jgi:uncharacterized protein (DUF1697 family)
MAHYVALLRGINVGGNNLIKMSALRACFEDHGFASVATYKQMTIRNWNTTTKLLALMDG